MLDLTRFPASTWWATPTSGPCATRRCSIADGDFVAITGPSGSGKSTLLQIVGLLDRPTSGTISLDGQDLADLDDEERARLRLVTIGFIFQRFHLLNDMTALENVAAADGGSRGAAQRALRPRGVSCWTRLASPTGCSSCPRSSRAASASGWRSLAPWPTTPG